MAAAALSATTGASLSTECARLIEHKQEEKRSLDSAMSTDEIIRDREELSEQIRALKELQQMATSYGFDISGPAAARGRRCSGSTSAIWQR